MQFAVGNQVATIGWPMILSVVAAIAVLIVRQGPGQGALSGVLKTIVEAIAKMLNLPPVVEEVEVVDEHAHNFETVDGLVCGLDCLREELVEINQHKLADDLDAALPQLIRALRKRQEA